MNSNRNKIILKCKGLKYKMTELSDVKNKLNVYAVDIWYTNKTCEIKNNLN